MDFLGWADLLRLEFFDHERLISALEKSPGKTKLSNARQYRVMNEGS